MYIDGWKLEINNDGIIAANQVNVKKTTKSNNGIHDKDILQIYIC